MQRALPVRSTKDAALHYETTPEHLVVYWHHLLVVKATPVLTSTAHVKWRCCQCPNRVLRNEGLFFQHAQAVHQDRFLRAACAGSTRVGYTGHVVSHEVRTRMLWPVASDDPRYR